MSKFKKISAILSFTFIGFLGLPINAIADNSRELLAVEFTDGVIIVNQYLAIDGKIHFIINSNSDNSEYLLTTPELKVIYDDGGYDYPRLEKFTSTSPRRLFYSFKPNSYEKISSIEINGLLINWRKM